MKLTRIELENFRCFERATFDLTDPETGAPLRVAVLAGGNGCGKSSVLQAVAGVVGGELMRLVIGEASYPDLGHVRISSREVRRGTKFGGISVAIRDLVPRRASQLAQVAGTVTCNLGQWYGRPVFPPSTMAWIDGSASESAATEWRQAPLEYRFAATGQIIAFDAFRILPRGPVDGPNNKLVPSHRLDGALRPTVAPDGTLHPRFTALKQWIVNLDYARAKQRADRGADAPAWDTLRQGLDTLLAPFKFAGVDDRFDVLFETPTGTVSIDELSDGLRSLFVIVAELVMRLSLCTDDPARVLEQEACCLIDEIDAHLHPRWQQTVLPGLTQLFPNVQFIVTTHSPLVVASVWPHQVFRLDPEWT